MVKIYICTCFDQRPFCVKWGWLAAYTTSTVHDISTFAVLFSVTRPFLSLHSCLWRALRVVLYEGILSIIESLDRVMAKFRQVVGLHAFRCYLHVAACSEFDTSIICHVFMPCFGSFLLQAMFLSLQVFPFKGQSMIRTVCKYSSRFLSRISYLSSYVFFGDAVPPGRAVPLLWDSYTFV